MAKGKTVKPKGKAPAQMAKAAPMMAAKMKGCKCNCK